MRAVVIYAVDVPEGAERMVTRGQVVAWLRFQLGETDRLPPNPLAGFDAKLVPGSLKVVL